jgi:hypothetical protein
MVISVPVFSITSIIAELLLLRLLRPTIVVCLPLLQFSIIGIPDSYRTERSGSLQKYLLIPLPLPANRKFRVEFMAILANSSPSKSINAIFYLHVTKVSKVVQT